MNLHTIATHTIDLSLLNPHSLVLDAGCRGFDFSDEMIKLGCDVIGLDPSEDVWDKTAFDSFCRFALVGIGMPTKARLVEAGNGSRLTFEDAADRDEVETTTIKWLSDFYGHFDVVKLDIEGSEYGVLLTWPGPVATQISVEYHEHTNLGKAVHGDDVYERIDKHLGQWYRKVKDDPMDTLFLLK